MNRIISTILLGLGLVVIIYGFSMADSLRIELSQLMTGIPSQRSVWLIIVGATISLIGIIGLRRKKPTKAKSA